MKISPVFHKNSTSEPFIRKFLLPMALVFFSPHGLCSGSLLSIPKHKDERLIIENLNITVESLLSAYMSGNLERKSLAEMYVIGVIDSSEGESWCSFKTISPSTLEEHVFTNLKTARDKNPKGRASNAIKAGLKAFAPCKK